MPTDLCNHNMEVLYLDNNMLDGEIPFDLGRCSELEDLYLSSNNLTESLPSQFGNLTSLQYLYISNNFFKWYDSLSLSSLNFLFIYMSKYLTLFMIL